MPRSGEISVASRIFVFLVFVGLGLSFLATTATLANEFRDDGWFDLAAADSHLFFLFFPTLGLVALIAFYLPSCALADLYWRHVPFGALRFAIGAVLLAALSYGIATTLLASPKRSIWEIAPSVLREDKGEPAGCASSGACERLPALTALQNLRRISQTRLGLSEFVRDCDRDDLLEATPGPEPKRFCFASTPLAQTPRLQSDAECCRAQQKLSDMVAAQFTNPDTRSQTARVHALLLPLKIFFLLVLLTISILLAFRHKAMERNYPEAMKSIEIGMIVGTVAVLFFPLMSQAFVQTSEVLFRAQRRGTFGRIVPSLSLAFGAWTLLTILFFYRRRDKELEALGKMGSAVAGAIAVLKYSIVIALIVRLLGSGADAFTLAGLILVTFVAAIAILWVPRKLERGNRGRPGALPSA